MKTRVATGLKTRGWEDKGVDWRLTSVEEKSSDRRTFHGRGNLLRKNDVCVGAWLGGFPRCFHSWRDQGEATLVVGSLIKNNVVGKFCWKNCRQ